MRTMMSRKAASAAALALVLAVGVASQAEASSVTYGFYNITNNSPIDSQTGSKYTVEVTDVGVLSTQVKFIFRNDSSNIQSTISEIYFDDGPLNSLVSIIDSPPGVDFKAGANPANLPSGNNATPAFVATQSLSAQAENPAPSKGINPGEQLSLVYSLDAGKTYSSVLDALYLGWIGQGGDPDALRIGIHVTNFADGKSESFINTPIPAALPIIGAALAGFGFVGWRQQRKPA